MKWLFVFLFVCLFFTFIEECCVVIEKNIKKLENRISYQYDTKDA